MVRLRRGKVLSLVVLLHCAGHSQSLHSFSFLSSGMVQEWKKRTGRVEFKVVLEVGMPEVALL